MIVLGEKRENLNIIHLIMGPETNFQFDMTGQCVLDITDNCKNSKENDHTIIVLNRCESEEILADKLKEMKEMHDSQENEEELCEDCKKEKNKQPQQSSNLSFKCPECHEEGKGIFRNGIVHPCKTCQRINEGIVKHNIPKEPSDKQLIKIMEEMIKNSPEQFDLLLEKYLKTQKKKKTNAT